MLTEKQKIDIAKFKEKLATPPSANELKERDGREYMPISFVETKLNEFYPAWQTRNFAHQVIANEIVGSIELGVLHPVLGEWIWYVGAAAVMIQLDANADIMDVSKKKKNTLEKDYPHLLSDCIKNAALKLGKAFGADLNRKEVDNFSVVTALNITDIPIEKIVVVVEHTLKLTETIDGVKSEFKRLPIDLQQLPIIFNCFKERGLEIQATKQLEGGK